MTQERASIFEDDDLDLAAFTPKAKTDQPKPDRVAIQEVAEQKGFASREPVRPKSTAAPAAVAVTDPPRREPRRYVTGRNRQLNLKVTEQAAERFYALADANRLVLGEAFEMAIEALEKDLASTGKGKRA
jgi:hypothetical protein